SLSPTTTTRMLPSKFLSQARSAYFSSSPAAALARYGMRTVMIDSDCSVFSDWTAGLLSVASMVAVAPVSATSISAAFCCLDSFAFFLDGDAVLDAVFFFGGAINFCFWWMDKKPAAIDETRGPMGG